MAQSALLEKRIRDAGRAESRPGRIARRAESTVPVPLSSAQQRLWFLEQLAPDTGGYNVTRTMRIEGALATDSLGRALEEVVGRHETLRTTVGDRDGQPVQIVGPAASSSLPVVGLENIPESSREAAALALALEEAERPFVLSRGPLLRATLFRLAPEHHLLQVTAHHIVTDGWSMEIFFREISSVYEGIASGGPSSLDPLPIQYSDFCDWQRQWLETEAARDQIAHWAGRLGGAAPLDFPTDNPRPAVPGFRGIHGTRMVPLRVLEGLRALAHSEGATLFMVLLAAFEAFLQRHTGQDDILVATPVAGRQRPELENLIGFFANTVVVRGDLSGKPTFRELVRRVRETALDAYAHQDVPFEKLVEVLRPTRSLGQNPLVDVLLALHNAPPSELRLSHARVTPVELARRTSRFDLELHARETADGLSWTVICSSDLFGEETLTRLLGRFEVLIDSIVRSPDRTIGELDLLPEPEWRQVVAEWNQTAREYPRGKTVHGLFEEQVERTPQADAVVFGGERLSYLDLNERANRLAAYLKKRGVGPEVLVGLCVERSLEMVVGLLGILKTGGAYLPLDPSYPQQRLAFMLEDSAARVVLTQESLAKSLPSGDFDRVRLDADWSEIARESGEKPQSGVRAENLAYVIYTSGSTGTPKGVAVEHRSVVNLLLSMRDGLSPQEGDVMLAITTLSFDIAGLEVYLPLVTGACVAVAARETVLDGRVLRDQLVQCGATMMQGTPTSWRLLLDAGWQGEGLRVVLCGGEAISRDLADRLLDKNLLVWNLYGPTETTIWSTGHQVKPDTGSVPIGTPLANTQVYILDGQGVPVPVGLPGDLYVAGAGLARGYLNRPELTAEKFVRDPFRTDKARMYKTGDRGRFLPGGDIQFLGRLDDQVKIRGFRIEIGEVEAAVARHPEVDACVVSARSEESGDKRLVGYVVARGGAQLSVLQLRDFLKITLPDHMIPATFVFLDALPLTPNGKIDRKALPAPEPSRTSAGDSFVAPRNPVEEALSRIWGQVLGIERVGVFDNFFDLGGHSLLATRLMVRVRDGFSVDLPLSTLFRSPTIAEFARVLEQEPATVASAPIVRLDRQSRRVKDSDPNGTRS
ncbi:MAG: amino acid adenylation domain-containing protein [Acidobacteriota bacterium]|nr:amino acid adenylation domain-containing protein [Acidobacteriota bacterium]